MTTTIKREVNLTHLIGVALPLLITMIGGWITTQSEIAKIKTEVEYLKMQRTQDKQELRDQMQEIKADIKEIKNLLLQQALENGKDK